MQSIANKYINTIDFLTLLSWDVKAYLNKSGIFNPSYTFVLFGEFLKKPQIQKVKIEDDKEYKILGVRSYGKGAYANRTVLGKTLKMREYQQAKVNHLFWCKVDTKNGAFGIITEDLADGVASSNMTFAEIDTSKINVYFLQLLFTSKGVMQYLDSFVTGTTNRKYIRPDQLLNDIKIPLPSIAEQEAIVNNYYSKIKVSFDLEKQASVLEGELERYLYTELGLEKEHKRLVVQKGLQFINFEIVAEWGLGKILSKSNKESANFPITTIEESPELVIDLFRGKSPRYKDGTSSFILNQKCNRWNEIDMNFVKTVDEDWLKSIDYRFLTKEGDVLINSTGEGTIG
ncbi:restriction endonuclease subunit S, partial [Candidatus Dojkabacteria bacterium]|nr:restriction endonuclease subunit S [Candidatus Dojkabacteria bacterium]